MIRHLLFAAALAAASVSSAFAGADEDWAAILALDAGPSAQPLTESQARSATLAHLARQQDAYQDFLKKYPDDPRCFEAKLRLAHLLAVRADSENNRRAASESRRLLDQLAADRSLPPARQADVAFARIALFMKRMNPASAGARKDLTRQVVEFQTLYPHDRRLPALLAEVATLYDAQPIYKRALLQQAARLCRDEELKARINDDLRRLELLGKPLTLKFQTLDGKRFDLAHCRGRVVVICFFADWSPPSIQTLQRVNALALQYPASRLLTVGISLDHDPETADAILRKYAVRWPVACDGRGWESPLVRQCGINALPTVWILDREGRLRVLDASRDCEMRVREMLKTVEPAHPIATGASDGI